MALKYPTLADTTGLSSLSCFPPRISPITPLLASVIPLPSNPLIVYTVWSPIPPASSNPLDVLPLIEQARKKSIQQSTSCAIVDSLFPSLHVHGHCTALYIFAISSADQPTPSHRALSTLAHVGLTVTQSASFSPADLYPCSDACSRVHTPCPTCLDSTKPRRHSGSAPLLPRQSLRRPFLQFLTGVRDHLIHRVTQPSQGINTHFGVSATRLKSGILFGTVPSSSEWRSGWEHYTQEHPLTYCEFLVCLEQNSRTSARIIVHPRPQLSPYHSLSSSHPIPLETPLILLPHGVPAYFLGQCTGPLPGLAAQFDDALLGFGAGNWKPRLAHPALPDPVFIIAWLPLQKPSGDKIGMTVVWPASLCVTAAEAPSHVQPHPEQMAKPLHQAWIPEDHISLSVFPPDNSAPSDIGGNQVSVQDLSQAAESLRLPPPGTNQMSTHRASQAFRTLSSQHSFQDIVAVTSEVSSFVDAVAREREKERERIRRERQVHGVSMAVSHDACAGSPTLSQSPTIANHVVTPGSANADSDAIMSVADANFYGDVFLGSRDISLSSPSVDGSTQGVMAMQSAQDRPPTSDTPLRLSPALPPADPVPSHLESFPAFDSSWSHSNNDLLPISTEYGNFHISMVPLGTVRDDMLDSVDDLAMDDSFGIFTEDDFKFFDGPRVMGVDDTTPIAPSATYDNQLLMKPDPPMLAGPLLVAPPSHDMRISGLGSSPATNPHLVPWDPHYTAENASQADAATFQAGGGTVAVQAEQGILKRHPPTVALSDQHVVTSAGGPFGRYHAAFDPIPFSATHKLSDEKYALGKFALPSPPESVDEAVTTPNNQLSVAPSVVWKSRYTNATDPRVRTVHSLTRTRRSQQPRGDMVTSPDHDDFYPDDDCRKSDTQPSDTSDSEDDESWVLEERFSPVTNPVTPPPSLPVGPSLLQTHFHHPFLSPLSAVAAPESFIPDGTSAAMSVPTPVSPAAILGGSSKKTKSLEAAVRILLREAVENPVWSEAWRANATTRSAKKPQRDLWPIDIRRIADLLNGLEPLVGPVDLNTLFKPLSFDHFDSGDLVQPFQSPMVSISKAGDVIHVLPPALRFWEKLGLSPRAGPKDVTAYFFYESGGEGRQQAVLNLLDRLSALYLIKGYGQHHAGHCGTGPQDGLVPTRFESFRKHLSTFVAQLPQTRHEIVIYILTPDTILQLMSPIIRQILSAIKRVNKTQQTGSAILFQFVPESLLTIITIPHPPNRSPLEVFVDSLYDRLPPPVDHAIIPDKIPRVDGARVCRRAPAFSLARSLLAKVSYAKEEVVGVLDVSNRNALLHIGYQITMCGKWLLVACVDQRGEAYDSKVWLTPDDETVDEFVINSVWSFGIGLAMGASVEWHVVISKRGPMTARELDAWACHLDTALNDSMSLPIQVSLLAVEDNDPWYLFPRNSDNDAWPNSASRVPKSSGSTTLDFSSTTFALHADTSYPMSFGTALETMSDSIPRDPNEFPSCEELGLLPVATSTLVHVPSDMDFTRISMLHLNFLHFESSPHSSMLLPIDEVEKVVTKNFYELGELAKAKWGPVVTPPLPLHLAALEVMLVTLESAEGTHPHTSNDM